ncbi:MAG: hypothetical protein Q9200_007677 [Gallowayella weberi]
MVALIKRSPIGAFIVATGDAYRNLVPQYIGLTIDYIVKNFDEPADEEDTSSKGKQRRTERSASAAAGIARYPFQWATDTPSFRQAIRQFTKDTQQLRTHPSVKQYIRLRDPPSTGNTPEHITPSLSPPPGFTLNNPIKPIPGSNIPLNNLPATTSSSRSRSQSDTQTSNTSVETTVFGNLQDNTQPTFPRLNPPFPRSQQHSAKREKNGGPNKHKHHLAHPDLKDHQDLVDTIFRDVHLFIERAKELVDLKGADMVRENLWLSLRGTALEWWTGEMSETEKRLAKLGNGIDEVTRLLLARFREPSTVAIPYAPVSPQRLPSVALDQRSRSHFSDSYLAVVAWRYGEVKIRSANFDGGCQAPSRVPSGWHQVNISVAGDCATGPRIPENRQLGSGNSTTASIKV